MFNVFVPASLLLSALALSACATKPEAVPTPVAAPAQVEAVAEEAALPEVAPEPAPVAIAEQPQISTQAAPKKKIRKVRKIAAKPASPQTPPPAPVIEEPAPVVAPAPPPAVTPEPAPPVAVAPPPAGEIAEPGLLKQYWVWLLGLLIATAAVIVWRRKT